MNRTDQSRTPRPESQAEARSPSFEVTREERVLIWEIARRARAIEDRVRAVDPGIPRTRPLEYEMDITAAHANGCPLRLAELADAPDSDFTHDVFGIRRHLDRETGKLGGCFVPRYAAPEPTR